MATIDKRIMQDGTVTYRVRVRRKGHPQQAASFTKLSEAKRWGQMMEGSIIQGRHFPTPEAKRHTVSDLLERYRTDVLPHKRASTVYNQVYHLHWWEAQLGHYALSAITPALIVGYWDKLARTRESTLPTKLLTC